MVIIFFTLFDKLIMNDLMSSYTLAIDFELAFSIAHSDDWSSFHMFGNQLVFNGIVSQNVSQPLARDEVLLAHSQSIFKSLQRECLQISLICFDGESFSSKIIKGSKNSVSSHDEMRDLIKELVHSCRLIGREISHVEISHTHLGEQFIEVSNQKLMKISTHGLSQRDLDCVKVLREFVDFPIKLRAVTPANMVYERVI